MDDVPKKDDKFRIQRKCFRLVFSNMDQQIRDNDIPISVTDPSVSQASRWLVHVLDNCAHGIRGIKWGMCARHGHKLKGFHMHLAYLLIKKYLTRDKKFPSCLGILGHVVQTDSSTGWGLDGILRTIWYCTQPHHEGGIEAIMKFLNDPELYIFRFGDGVSIAGISDVKTLNYQFIRYWLCEYQRTATLDAMKDKSLEIQSILLSSGAGSDSGANNNKNENKNKSKTGFDFFLSNYKTPTKQTNKYQNNLRGVKPDMMAAIQKGLPLSDVQKIDPAYYLKNLQAIRNIWHEIKQTHQWTPSKAKEFNPMDEDFAKLTKPNKAIIRYYVIKLVKGINAKGIQELLITGDSGKGKSSLIKRGFGAVSKVDVIQFEPAGWCEGAVPNNQDFIGICGLKPIHLHNKTGFTIDFFEKMGDMSPCRVPLRYNSAQPEFNSPSTVSLLIDSNHRMHELFTPDEIKNVIGARMNEIHCPKSDSFFAATDFIRKINGLPPIKDEQDDINELRALINFSPNDE